MILAAALPIAETWFLWSLTWPGPGWRYVGKREGFGWVNYLWRRDDDS